MQRVSKISSSLCLSSQFRLVNYNLRFRQFGIEMDHLYKTQLQSYALKQNMQLPVYATEREGPPHAPQFRCKVTVCGQTFQSLEFCRTLKAAEHAAAKLALSSLAPLTPEGIDVAYKNLLQEIAQKENALLPTYATSASGPPHSRTFSSTVEYAGKVFRGEDAKTKKLAEMSAAKVAFMSIQYGHQVQTSSPSLACERQAAANPIVKRSRQEIPSQQSKMVTPDVQLTWVEVHEEELDNARKSATNNAKEINIGASRVLVNPTQDGTLNATNATDMNITDAASPKAENPSNDGSEASSCVEESKSKLIMGTGHLSMPYGQHVVCHPWNPEMTLPQDTEMVFRDDKFIAYRHVKP